MLVRIFDANRYDLRGRESQLRAAGIDERWEVRPTPSRNALLAELDADASSSPRRHSVALIDCRAESGDLEQLGFRVIETITRHSYLWKATRPIIWVDELTEANRRYVSGVGAAAILDDDWLDRSDAANLTEVLEEAAEWTPRSFADQDEVRVFGAEGAPRDEGRERADRFKRWFGFDPDEDGLYFHLLWGLADAVELKFLYRYCHQQELAPSETAARKACERLQEAMREEREHLDRAEPTNAEIARRFLAEAAPAEPDPLSELAWPAINHVRHMLHERPEIRKWAYLEDGAESALEQFLATLGQPPTIGARYEEMLQAIEQLATGSGRRVAATHGLLHRSCHALDDAFCDWRAHGPPSVITD